MPETKTRNKAQTTGSLIGPIEFLQAEPVNPVRQNKNKLSAVCLKFLCVHYQQVITRFFLVQFGVNKYLYIFQRPQIARARRARAIWLVFENLLVLIYSKLHSKSCDYLHILSSLFKIPLCRTDVLQGLIWNLNNCLSQ